MGDRDRANETSRREAAQSAVVDEEAEAQEVPGRVIKQMVSMRLEAQLLKDLRLLARERGESVSDLLREAAINLLADARPGAVRMTLQTVAKPQLTPTFASSADFTFGVVRVDSDESGSGSAGFLSVVQRAS